MTKHPNMLLPTSHEILKIGSNQTIHVPKTTPIFAPWEGKSVDDDYSGKQFLT
jgi:hypothetical protein